ncbi:MAG: hypothetical protein SO314_00525 [Alphaproteobacteria bacterium]|nr:hypothetical protein [Alphaproteobacteria bacterium]
MKHTMLHMKLNSAVSVFAVAAAFSVLLPPSDAYCGICFLPDCGDDKLAGGGDINMNINEDSEYCEKKGYTYYASGKCPQYYAVVGTCNRDDHYLKCDAQTWCKQNGYNTTENSCSIPQYADQPCPSYNSLYKDCKTDNARACQDTGYVNTCPSGQKLKNTSGRCSYDSSYGTCCTPSGCPSYTSLTSSSYGTNGTDGCEYTCYYTCNPNCPSSYPYSSDPTGCSSSTTNGCGNKTCYNSVSCDPCPGYYSCGGTWQYCTGTTCSDGSKRCSNYCVNDYFPNSCSNSSYCNGVYRNGYCSGSCNPPASSGSGSSGGSSGESSGGGSSEGRYGIWNGDYVCWTCSGGYCLVQSVDVYCSTTGAFICTRQGYKSSSKVWSTKAACQAEYSSNIKSGFGAGQRYSTQSGSCSVCSYW